MQDTRQPYRVSDADLLLYAEEGIDTFLRIRPDLKIGITRTPGQVPATFDEGGYTPLLTEFIAAKAELRDDQAMNETRVVALMQKVQGGLVSTGI
jgi:hypothetical protein